MASFKKFLKNKLVSRDLDHLVDSIPKTMGSFGYDPWGYSSDSLKISMSVFSFLYEKYFRTEAYGLENVPKEGRVLLISNHGGQIPLDGLLIGYSLATSPHGPRAARAMIERWVPTLPFVGNILNELGAVIGDPVNCAKMLRKEEAVIVFPEGVRGSGKVFMDRYQLQRFGTGFMHLALTEAAPVVPVAVIGCEETVPSLMNVKPLAKALNMPYFPLALPFPMPAKVRIYIGKPMVFKGGDVDEAQTQVYVDQVRDAIADLIEQGLKSRKGWFT